MLAFEEVRWFDVKPYLLTGEQPVILLPIPKAHKEAKAWAGRTEIGNTAEFWVPQGPVLGGDQKWSITKTGDVVRIPVFAYKIDRALACVWGLGLQIGMATIADLRRQTSDIPKSITLVLGSECTDLAPTENAFRCYAGIAVRTK